MPAAVAVPERLSRPPLDQGPRRAPHEPHGPPRPPSPSRRRGATAPGPTRPLPPSPFAVAVREPQPDSTRHGTRRTLDDPHPPPCAVSVPPFRRAPRPPPSVPPRPRPPSPSRRRGATAPGPTRPLPPSPLPSADPDTRSTTNPEEHPTSPMGRPGAVAVEASRSREARSPHPGSRPRFPLGGAAKLPRYRATGRPRPALRAVRGWSLNTIAATPLPPAGLVSEIRRPRGRPRQRRAAKRLRGGFAKRVVRSGGPRSAPSGLTLGTAPGRLREARGPLGALRGRRRPG
jgi:hypothetical protein